MVAHPVNINTAPAPTTAIIISLIRLKHSSIRTEQVYTDWIKRFILLVCKRRDGRGVFLFFAFDP